MVVQSLHKSKFFHTDRVSYLLTPYGALSTLSDYEGESAQTEWTR